MLAWTWHACIIQNDHFHVKMRNEENVEDFR